MLSTEKCCIQCNMWFTKDEKMPQNTNERDTVSKNEKKKKKRDEAFMPSSYILHWQWYPSSYYQKFFSK